MSSPPGPRACRSTGWCCAIRCGSPSNPFISAIGWVLPHLVSGVTITAIVLNLLTAGPLLLRALVSQDMYLAGSFILLLSALTRVGMLVSDLLLALLDPRIRFS